MGGDCTVCSGVCQIGRLCGLHILERRFFYRFLFIRTVKVSQVDVQPKRLSGLSSSGLPLVVTTSLVFSSDDPDFGLGPLDGHSSNSVFRRLAVFGLLSISSVLPSPWVQAQVMLSSLCRKRRWGCVQESLMAFWIQDCQQGLFVD